MNLSSFHWQPLLDRWQLTRDGAPFATPGSELLPVRWQGHPAMLKRALAPEEKSGGVLLHWWDGDGAAQVYAHDEDTVLMERATGSGDLFTMVLEGQNESSMLAARAILRGCGPRNSCCAGSPASGNCPNTYHWNDCTAT